MNQSNIDEPKDRILFRPDLMKELGVCTDTIRVWLKAGTLPKPDIALSRQTLGWRLSTLRAAGIGLV